MRLDKAHWPSCLLWHGWPPMLSGVNGASSWAADASECAGYLFEARYSSDLLARWGPTDEYDGVEAACLSGLMVALFLIRSLVSLLEVQGSSLTKLRITGVVAGGVMLVVFSRG